MGRAVALIGCCALVAAAPPVRAQTPPRPSVARAPSTRPVAANDDLPLRRRVASCLSAAPTRPLIDWLTTLPGSSQDAPLASRFSLAACMAKEPGGWSRFGARDSQFRLLLAEALVARRLATLPSAPPAQAANARWFDAKLAALPAGAKVDRDTLALEDFGSCVAQADWTGAVTLMRAPRGSPAEKAVVARLSPRFAPCTSLMLKLDRPTLRLIVASGIYHIAVAPALTASVS